MSTTTIIKEWREIGGESNGRDEHARMDDDPDGERKRSRKDKKRSRSRSRDRKKRSRSKSRDRKRDRKRSRSHERKRSDRRRRSRSRSKSRDLIKRRRSRSRSGTPSRLKLGPKRRKSRSLSPIRLEDHPMSPEERDARTVFCMQLSQRVRARDMEDFFSSVGKVRDVRMITCNKTRRFKGIAYVEFKDIESVALAIGLNGQKLLGVPIIVQPSQAEKNRAGQLAKAGAMAAAMSTSTTAPGPMKLYVGSLHFNITEDMLKGIFEPFGRIDEILLMKDHETGRSKGFGFITFHEGEDAKRAMEQLNGFEIAGRPMKVGYVTAGSGEYFHNPQTYLDTDDMDRAGVNLGVTGRLQLMAKLAEGTDLKIPEAAATALNMQSQISQHSYNAAATQGIAVAPTTPLVAPSIATQCFMLSNMFDPNQEANNPSFEREMRDDVIEACQPHGGAFHVFVDKLSPQGNVYVKCPSISAAVAAVNTLHGRWFAGRLITAAYVPLLNYHSLFPDAMACNKNL